MKRKKLASMVLGTILLSSLSISSNSTNQVQASVNKATVNYVEGYGIATWKNIQGQAQTTGHYLPTDSQWIVNTTTKGQDNRSWYLVGNDEWASEQYYDLADENSTQQLNAIVTINYVPTYSVNVWSSPTESANVTGKVKHGNDFKVFQKKVINGQVWYELGANQWLNGKYAQIKVETSRGQKTFQSPQMSNTTTPSQPINNDLKNGGVTAVELNKWTLEFTDDVKPELNLKRGDKIFNSEQEANDYAMNLWRTKSSGSVSWMSETWDPDLN